MTNPVFSVILPVYNVEKYLEHCLESIQNQTFKDFEVLCVDDASTDSSLSLLEEFSKKDNRFKIFRHITNQSLGSARNTALSNVRGEYICCVDSDDWIDVTLLEKVYNAFEQNNVDSVWYNAWEYYEHNGSKKEFPLVLNKTKIGEIQEGPLTITSENIGYYAVNSWLKVYRTSVIREHNICWLPKVYYEDVFFHFNYFIVAPQVYVINDNLYYYLRRKASITGNNKLKLSRDEDMYKNLIEIYKKNMSNSKFENYKDSIIDFGNRYKRQIKFTSVSPFILPMYNKFLSEIKALESNQ